MHRHTVGCLPIQQSSSPQALDQSTIIDDTLEYIRSTSPHQSDCYRPGPLANPLPSAPILDAPPVQSPLPNEHELLLSDTVRHLIGISVESHQRLLSRCDPEDQVRSVVHSRVRGRARGSIAALGNHEP